MSNFVAIKLLKPWGGYEKNKILSIVPAGQANLLIERKIAKPHLAKPEKQEDEPVKVKKVRKKAKRSK